MLLRARTLAASDAAQAAGLDPSSNACATFALCRWLLDLRLPGGVAESVEVAAYFLNGPTGRYLIKSGQ